MEIDLCNSLRKVFKEAQDERKVHIATVAHAEDELICTHICAFEPDVQKS